MKKVIEDIDDIIKEVKDDLHNLEIITIPESERDKWVNLPKDFKVARYELDGNLNFVARPASEKYERLNQKLIKAKDAEKKAYYRNKMFYEIAGIDYAKISSMGWIIIHELEGIKEYFEKGYVELGIRLLIKALRKLLEFKSKLTPSKKRHKGGKNKIGKTKLTPAQVQKIKVFLLEGMRAGQGYKKELLPTAAENFKISEETIRKNSALQAATLKKLL